MKYQLRRDSVTLKRKENKKGTSNSTNAKRNTKLQLTSLPEMAAVYPTHTIIYGSFMYAHIINTYSTTRII